MDSDLIINQIIILASPIVKLMRENLNPQFTLIIENDRIRIVEDVESIPIKKAYQLK